MPLEQYDRYFGGKKGAAEKAAKALRKEYGATKAQQMFYAIVNKRRRQQHGSGYGKRPPPKAGSMSHGMRR